MDRQAVDEEVRKLVEGKFKEAKREIEEMKREAKREIEEWRKQCEEEVEEAKRDAKDELAKNLELAEDELARRRAEVEQQAVVAEIARVAAEAEWRLGGARIAAWQEYRRTELDEAWTEGFRAAWRSGW